VTKSQDNDEHQEEVVAKTETIMPMWTGSQPIKSTEADFAGYLSGEMKNPIERERSKKPKRERVGRKIALDNEKELFSHIARIQIMRKEESRLKTVANVNRALWGNVIICTAKFGAWLSSGSSAMLAEFIHSVVDCGNQTLLLVGLRHSSMAADRKHPYGYGKNIYFWALVSALGTFFLGAGVSMTHAIGDLMHPSLNVINWEVWGVLGLSFVVDGYVLRKTIQETLTTKPKGMSYLKHLGNIRDPALLAVLLEDGAACLGIIMCFGGIAASHYTGNPIFDGVAGVGISALLGVMGLALVRMNHRFLLGQAVDRDITDDIEKILLSRRSVDSIGSVQSQWTGPDTFSYKAEVDFDGTYLAAKLMPIYQHEFIQIRNSMDEELQVLLSLYAEDVIRTVEREVRHIEARVRKKYPGAEYIELEPMSRDADRLAIDDNLEGELRRVESDALNRFLKTLRKEEAAASKEEKETTAANAAREEDAKK
jgi:zinc transporter 9